MIMTTFMADLQNLYQRRWKEPQKLEKIYLIMWCMLVKAPDICPSALPRQPLYFYALSMDIPPFNQAAGEKWPHPIG